MDEVSPAAELMGAINTVVIKDGKAIGRNTDGAGFMRNIKENGVDVVGKKVTVMGAGGAAMAIYTQAALDGVAAIDVYKRKNDSYDAAAEHIAHIAEKPGATFVWSIWQIRMP